jgi:hypothetical protein
VIISVAVTVKGVFDANDQKRTQQEILDRLGQIENTLVDVDSKLSTIIARFTELEFHIDQKFEEQRKIDVITAIKRINQHYPTWTNGKWRPGSNPAVPEPSIILEDLRTKTTALREQGSYVNYATVALAMGYERILLQRVFRVKTTDPDMQRGFEQYAVFFRAAAAASQSKAPTIGFRWSQANNDWTSFKVAFEQRPLPLRCDTGTMICCEQPLNWWYVGKLINRYDGDLLKGFTQVAEESHLLMGPGGDAAGLCRNSDHPAFPRRTGCPADIGTASVGPCDFGQQHDAAVTKKQIVDDLNAALDSLHDFNLQAEGWAGIPSSKSVFPDPRIKRALDVQMIDRLKANPRLVPAM